MSEWSSTDNPFDGPTIEDSDDETDAIGVDPETRDGGSETVENREDDSPSAEKETEADDAEPVHTPAEIHYDAENYDGEDETVEKWIQRGEYKHVPVYGYAMAHIHTRKYDPKDDQDYEKTVNGKSFSWWEDRSLIPKHPYILINPLILAHHTVKYEDQAGVPTREMLNLDKRNQFTVVDSGGFQVVTQDDVQTVDSYEEHDFHEKKVYPPALVEWQVENGDAGTILDMPPYGAYGDSGNKQIGKELTETQWEETLFQDRLDWTTKNAEIMWDRLQEMREDGNERAQDYRFMGVLQGQPSTLEKKDEWRFLRKWHEQVEPVAEYEGWAVSPTPSKHMGQLAIHLAYADNYIDTDYLHVLAAGSYQARALMTYASILQDVFVTSDSSGYARGSMFRSVILPNPESDFYEEYTHPNYAPTDEELEDAQAILEKEMPERDFKVERDKPRIGRAMSNRDIIITQWDKGSDCDVESPDLDRFPCRIEPFVSIGKEYGIDYLTETSGSDRSTAMALHNLNREFDATAMIDAFLHNYGKEVVDDFEVENKRPKVLGNSFWKVMNDYLSEKNLVELYYAMDFLRIAHEDGIAAAFDKDGGGYNIPGKFGGDEGWTIKKGANSALSGF